MYIISIIVGISIFILFLVLSPKDENLAAKRLKKLSQNTKEVNQNTKEKISENLLFEDNDYKINFLKKVFDRFNFSTNIKALIRESNVKITVDIFIIISCLPLILAVLTAVSMIKIAILIMITGIVGSCVPYLILKIKAKKRLEKFTAQFPEALDLMSNALRAGHSLLSSFQMISQEMADPVSTIFKIVYDDISLGIDIRKALDNMTGYMPRSVDLSFFITAVQIQREIGGNLAEVLDNLIYTIRERFKLLGQIKTQTAQAKLSGLVLAIAPLIVTLIIWIMNPEYLQPLFKTTLGNIILFITFVLAVTGYMIINKITNIRV
jgi:tight adherence protein B